MPTLTRLLLSLALVALLIYGGMLALVTFVEPATGEMSIRIPPEKLAPKTGTLEKPAGSS
ncbi:hypothetical protein GCM10011491_18360 [Brucella endophytica]|uniref:Histidine kinase n=1 Tax=Brucella endophytica TaxID=1963359 RepID=A0A916SCF1_9HYPH|nr:histidine kinase [Brucella endophytica]GGA90738.1 hypothetical protein GCM10011491_18360 [Brucella endophytica]